MTAEVMSGDRRPARETPPVLCAALLAGAYLLVAGSWIVVSGEVARGGAHSPEELAAIERWKGLGFVAVTGLLLFTGAAWLFARLERQHAEIRRQREALLLAERRAANGLLAAALAHDCRNLLTVLSCNTDLLQEHVAHDPEARELHRALEDGIQRLASTATRLKDPGAMLDGMRVVDLARLLHDEADVARGHPAVRGCRLEIRAEPLRARVHPEGLKNALFNLILNAAEATGGSGRVLLRLFAAGDAARLEVHDDGPGIAAEARDQLFEPSFSTKPHGSGLGLFSVEACVQAHGGTIEVGRSELGGARFTISLPLGGGGAPAAPAKDRQQAPAG